MKASRLDGLVDGIFAIVMTLLIIEIRVPEFHEQVSSKELWHALTELAPLCLSYVLSFSLLFTYWRGYCYVISGASSFNVKLTNRTALFLFFVGLLPFTTHLLGRYSYSELAIVLYGLNIVFIGMSLYWMRKHVLKTNPVEITPVSARALRHATIRILTPVFCALIAIALCAVNTNASMILFTLLIIFNLTQAGADLVDYLTSRGEKR